jgi:uncharacterized membrane protein YvbJ
MVEEQQFTCQQCGKQFTVKGTWWNQLLYNRIGNLIFYSHCIKNHKENLSKPYAYYKWLKEAVLIFLITILTILLKIVWLVTLPFAIINDIAS